MDLLVHHCALLVAMYRDSRWRARAELFFECRASQTTRQDKQAGAAQRLEQGAHKTKPQQIEISTSYSTEGRRHDANGINTCIWSIWNRLGGRVDVYLLLPRGIYRERVTVLEHRLRPTTYTPEIHTLTANLRRTIYNNLIDSILVVNTSNGSTQREDDEGTYVVCTADTVGHMPEIGVMI